MRNLRGLCLLFLPLVALQLLASDGSNSTGADASRMPATANTDGAGSATTTEDLKKLRQQIAKQQEEIKRLQQSVEEQEKALDRAVAAITARPAAAPVSTVN